MNTVGKGDADGVYVRDKRRHPGQEVAEVQQDVEGLGNHTYDQHHDRLVEHPL